MSFVWGIRVRVGVGVRVSVRVGVRVISLRDSFSVLLGPTPAASLHVNDSRKKILVLIFKYVLLNKRHILQVLRDMTSQQEVIHDSEPSALDSTEPGSVEPSDVTAPSDVYQVTVEPHVQSDDDYKATSGGEIIPRTPIRRPFRIALAVFSGWMILCGREQLLLLLIFLTTSFRAVCKVE